MSAMLPDDLIGLQDQDLFNRSPFDERAGQCDQGFSSRCICTSGTLRWLGRRQTRVLKLG
jgi:hypothetical protein